MTITISVNCDHFSDSTSENSLDENFNNCIQQSDFDLVVKDITFNGTSPVGSKNNLSRKKLRIEIENAVRNILNMSSEQSSDMIDQRNRQRFIVNKTEKLLFLNSDDISYCNSDGNYTTIHLDNKKAIFICSSIKKVEESLCEDFFRIHHSYLINLNKIKEYLKKESSVLLQNGIKIPVSRRKKSLFVQNFLSVKSKDK